MTPCINDCCSTEMVYAVPVDIPVCVLVQPINTVYVRSRFFSADTTAWCTEERNRNSVHVSRANETIFHQSGHDSRAPKKFSFIEYITVRHPRSFPSWVHDSRPRNMNFLQCIHDGQVNSHFLKRMQTTILNFIKMTEGSPKSVYCRHIKKGFFRKGLTFYQTRKLWTELILKVIADDKMNVPQLVISILIG